MKGLPILDCRLPIGACVAGFARVGAIIAQLCEVIGRIRYVQSRSYVGEPVNRDPRQFIWRVNQFGWLA